MCSRTARSTSKPRSVRRSRWAARSASRPRSRPSAAARREADLLERGVLGVVDGAQRADVARELVRREPAEEALDELGGGHDLDPELAHELDRPGVDAREVRDGRAREV